MSRGLGDVYKRQFLDSGHVGQVVDGSRHAFWVFFVSSHGMLERRVLRGQDLIVTILLLQEGCS